jgi:hypothetical protein
MRFHAMRLYALVEAGDPEAIDVYLCEQARGGRLRTVCGMSLSGVAFSVSRSPN